MCRGSISAGRLVHARGYGLANLDFDIPNSSITVFNVASMAKQFTAMRIDLLGQQGKISLDDDIRKTFGKCLTTVRASVFVISYHTSGLRDYTELIELADDRLRMFIR